MQDDAASAVARIAAVVDAWSALPPADQAVLASAVVKNSGWREKMLAEARIHAFNSTWHALTETEQTLCARAIIDALGWSVIDAPPLYPPPDPLAAPLSSRKRLLADLWRGLPVREREAFLAVATAAGFAPADPPA